MLQRPPQRGDKITESFVRELASTVDQLRRQVDLVGRNPKGGGTQRFRVKSEEDNHLVCRRYDGDHEGDNDVKVAKPWGLRVDDGVEKTTVNPRYLVDDEIHATAWPLGGTGVEVSGETVTWLDDNRRGRRFGPIWGRVTGSTSIGSNRWTYNITQVEPDGTSWPDVSDGVTLTGVLNAIEAENDGSSIEGHGVNVDGGAYPDGFDVKPIRGEPVVLVWPTWKASDDIRWAFSVTNADDGTCNA